MTDYELTLYYTLWGEWDELFTLMIRTKDDMLAKKIQYFLNAYHFSGDQRNILKLHDDLLYYVDHALKSTPGLTMKM